MFPFSKLIVDPNQFLTERFLIAADAAIYGIGTHMRFIRWFLGKIILFLDAMFSPKTRDLSAMEKNKIAEASSSLSLYQFESCPFCVKVRRFLKAEGISLPLVDATREPGRGELLKGGGALQVPCLKIQKPDGTTEWLYESNDIISYFRKNVAAKS